MKSLSGVKSAAIGGSIAVLAGAAFLAYRRMRDASSYESMSNATRTQSASNIPTKRVVANTSPELDQQSTGEDGSVSVDLSSSDIAPKPGRVQQIDARKRKVGYGY